MLVEFSVSNFRSFKGQVSFSMVADKSLKRNSSRLIKTGESFDLLPTAIILGGNSSGKSNLLKAFQFYLRVMDGQKGYESSDEPFLLADKTSNKPTSMMAIFWDVKSKSSYEYGFDIKKDGDNWQISKEYFKVGSRKQKRFGYKTVFERVIKAGNSQLKTDKSIKASLKDLLQKTKPDVSAISVLGQFEIGSVQAFESVRKRGTYTAFGHSDGFFGKAVTIFQKQENIRKRVVGLMTQADLCITDMESVESPLSLSDFHTQTGIKVDISSGDPKIVRKDVMAYHKDGVKFSMRNQESAGTNRMFCLAVFLSLALEGGGLALVDDLDAELHPLLTKALVDQFENPDTNPNRSQLICTTHEYYLLSPDVDLRHDQIWLSEKGDQEETKMIPISDYEDRHGRRLDINYLNGSFGGVPSLNLDEPSLE